MNQDNSTSTVDRFLISLKDPNMEAILQSLKTLKIKYQSSFSYFFLILIYFFLIDNDENLDLYMIEKVLPILFAGMEELSKEVERYQKSGIRNYIILLISFCFKIKCKKVFNSRNIIYFL